MRELCRLAGALIIICCGASLALAVVHKYTREPIAHQKHMQTIRAVSAVFPGYEDAAGLRVVGMPVCDEAAQESGPDVCRTLYCIRHLHHILGTAFSVTAPGYAGPIVLMLGMTGADVLSGIHVISHTETPGLGSHISGEAFRRQFAGRASSETIWALRKNGGDIDHITGATVSSAAVVKAVEAGLSFYMHNKEAIAAAAASAGD